MRGTGRVRRRVARVLGVLLLAASVPGLAGCPVGARAAGPGPAISVGAAHSLHLRADGTVWAWGANQAGQLGNGTRDNSATPVRVAFPPAAALPIARVAAGGFHSVAVDAAGRLWAWGLTDPPEVHQPTPVEIPRPAAMAVPLNGLAAGYTHTLAIDRNGQVWAWGTDEYGELGDGGGPNRTSPVPVEMPPAARTPIIMVSAGVDQSLALDSAGQVWVWGAPGAGSHEICQRRENCFWIPRPRQVPLPAGLRQPVTGIAAGSERAVLLDSAGRAWLADFTTAVGPAVEISGGYPRLRLVTAGTDHWLALDGDGRLWAWGEGMSGKLGDGSDTDRDVPVPVSLPSSLKLPVAAVAAGSTHSLALDAAGRVWAWGADNLDQLGPGQTTDRAIPVQVG